MNRTTMLFATTAALALLFGSAVAQQYPSKQISLIVPFTAGGQQDVEARALAQSMEPRLQKPVIVENKPGAGAAIGIGFVAKAAPDGHTILVTGAGAALLKVIAKDLGFDPGKDLAPVSILSSGNSLIVTNRQTGAKDWKEFMEIARKNPGKLNYGSLGVSSVTLAMEGLKSASGNLPINEIPYKGAADYTTALLRNDVQLILSTYGSLKTQIDSGAIVPLMQINEKRYSALPNLPTTVELGVGEKIRPFAWTGVFVPTGTPAAIIDRIYGEVAYYVKQPETIKRAQGFYTDMVGSTPAEFKKVYDADVVAWAAVAKAINLQPQ